MPFTAALAGFSEGVASLKQATSDGFSVSGEGVQVLLDAANEFYADLDEMSGEIRFLGEEWPIGTTPGAQVYRPHFAATASDPQQGVVAAVNKLKEELRTIRESLEKARATYTDADEGGVQGVKNAGSTLI